MVAAKRDRNSALASLRILRINDATAVTAGYAPLSLWIAFHPNTDQARSSPVRACCTALPLEGFTPWRAKPSKGPFCPKLLHTGLTANISPTKLIGL